MRCCFIYNFYMFVGTLQTYVYDMQGRLSNIHAIHVYQCRKPWQILAGYFLKVQYSKLS